MDHVLSPSGGHRRRISAEQRVDLLTRYEGSGLPQRDFAAREGVALSTLTYWLRRARTDPKRPAAAPLRFGEVSLPATHSNGGAWIAEVSLPGGRTLRLGVGVSEQLVQQLVRALVC